MAKADPATNVSRFILLASVGVVLTGLYFAQEVLIPLALAGLLSFLLAPLVKWLEYLRLPRVVAVLATVLIAFSLLFGIGWIVFNQVGDLNANMKTYRQNVTTKLDHMRQRGGLLNWVHTAGTEVKQVLAAPSSQPTQGLPVRIVSNDYDNNSSQTSPLELLRPLDHLCWVRWAPHLS